MSYWTAGSAIVGGVSSIYSASQSGGEEGGELPDYMRDPTRAYFNQQNPLTPDSRGFWQKYNPQMYEGNRTAQMPTWLKQDLRDYRDTADDPNSNFGLAQQYTRDQVNGDYLGLNPAMQQAVMNPAMDEMSSRFAKMGRSGMNPNNTQAQLSAGLGALMPYHDNALNRQMTAAAALPGFDTEAMNRQQYAGDAFMAQKQNRINDDIYRQDWQNGGKYLDKMQNWQGLLNPDSSLRTQPGAAGPDYLGAGIGGALMGSQLYNSYQNYQSPYSGASDTGTIMSSSGGVPSDTTGMYDLNYNFGGV